MLYASSNVKDRVRAELKLGAILAKESDVVFAPRTISDSNNQYWCALRRTNHRNKTEGLPLVQRLVAEEPRNGELSNRPV